jgi:hypothetical protein
VTVTGLCNDPGSCFCNYSPLGESNSLEFPFAVGANYFISSAEHNFSRVSVRLRGCLEKMFEAEN